jgi:hypothetical protein
MQPNSATAATVTPGTAVVPSAAPPSGGTPEAGFVSREAPAPPTARDLGQEEIATGRAARVGAWIFYPGVVLALLWGLSMRDTGYLTPETGTGYWLGIAGASLMLALVLYPIRKRARFMRGWGAVRHWFRAHMIKGIVGPSLVLFHANFQTGSVNGTVAMVAMLTVAGSGLLGRYVYTQIHYGLYGRKADLAALREDAAAAGVLLSEQFAFAPQLSGHLADIETRFLHPRGALARAWQLATLGLALAVTRLKVRSFIGQALALRADRHGWDAAELRRQRREADAFLTDFLGRLRKAVRFSFYERLFSLWHLLHMPLFLLLIGAGIVHVVAVHAY